MIGMVAPQTNPVHLFRTLLRECTYLPDPRARTYMHDYVLWSYRTYLPKRMPRTPISFKRQVKLLHRGRKWLSMLHRANEGYLKPLEKVLMITYGRSGKRRRELMQKLMAPEPLMTTEEIAKSTAPELYVKAWTPPAKVDALLRSQSQHRTWLDRQSGKMQIKSNVPEENSWGKPMHPSRRKNLTRRWYVKQLDYLYPPLPYFEHKELQARVNGQREWDGPIPRRTRPRGDSDLKITTPSEKTLLEGPEKGHTFSKYVNGRPHQLTLRLMRSLWAVVFKHVPLLGWNLEKKRWTVTWGDPVKPPELVAPPAAARDALLFSSPSSEARHPA